MYRQGDLLFIKTTEAPQGVKLKDKTILCSSVTGHAHKITKGVVWSNGDNRPSYYLEIPEGGSDLVHEEHKTIPLPEGTYQVIRQREVTGYVQD